MRELFHNRLAFIVLAVFLLISPASAKTDKPLARTEWKVDYLGGAAPIDRRAKVIVTMEGSELVLTPSSGVPFTVDVRSINLVSSRTKGTHPASAAEAQFLKAFVSDSSINCGCQGAGAVVFFTAALIAVSYPITSRDYIVSIGWREGASDEEIILRVGRKEYASFLSELEKATGKSWQNIDRQWEKVKQELAAQHGIKIPLTLSRAARLSKFPLKAGKYQAVLLSLDNVRNNLFVFPSDQVDLNHLSVVVEVELMPPSPEANPDSVVYTDENGTLSIAEIRTLSNTLRIQ